MKFYAPAKLLTLDAKRRMLVSKGALIMRVSSVMVSVQLSALNMKFFVKADGCLMDAEVQTFATQEQPMSTATFAQITQLPTIASKRVKRMKSCVPAKKTRLDAEKKTCVSQRQKM